MNCSYIIINEYVCFSILFLQASIACCKAVCRQYIMITSLVLVTSIKHPLPGLFLEVLKAILYMLVGDPWGRLLSPPLSLLKPPVWWPLPAAMRLPL